MSNCELGAIFVIPSQEDLLALKLHVTHATSRKSFNSFIFVITSSHDGMGQSVLVSPKQYLLNIWIFTISSKFPAMNPSRGYKLIAIYSSDAQIQNPDSDKDAEYNSLGGTGGGAKARRGKSVSAWPNHRPIKREKSFVPNFQEKPIVRKYEWRLLREASMHISCFKHIQPKSGDIYRIGPAQPLKRTNEQISYSITLHYIPL